MLRLAIPRVTEVGSWPGREFDRVEDALRLRWRLLRMLPKRLLDLFCDDSVGHWFGDAMISVDEYVMSKVQVGLLCVEYLGRLLSSVRCR
jgi:hypothetical protein